MTEQHEVELKLVVDPADADRLAKAAIFAQAVTREQRSAYFDTPAGAVRKAGFSLRVRTIDGAHVQTVKADGGATAGLFVRPEWERTIAQDRPELDRALLPALFPAGKKLAELDEIFAVTVARTAADHATADGSVEIVLDRGEVAAGTLREPVCEIELELAKGGAATLFALARELDAIAPVHPGVLTKAERGQRLASGKRDRPVRAEPIPLAPGMSTAAGFQAIAHACLRQFGLNREILARTGDPDALHQARVGLRRLRSVLSMFKAVVADEDSQRFRDGLRGIAGVLGEVRDLDVLVGRTEDADVKTRLTAAREDAYARATAVLAAPDSRALMIDLVEWLTIGRWLTDPADPALLGRPIEQFAAHALDRARRRLKHAGRGLASLDDEQRHRARIAAKKLRYASGFFAPLFDGAKAARRRKAFLAALEALQTDLGALNDLATAPAVLDRLGLPQESWPPPGSGRQGRKALLRRSEEAYEALVDAKRFWR